MFMTGNDYFMRLFYNKGFIRYIIFNVRAFNYSQKDIFSIIYVRMDSLTCVWLMIPLDDEFRLPFCRTLKNGF